MLPPVQPNRLTFRRKSNRRMSVQDFLQKVDSKIEGTTSPLAATRGCAYPHRLGFCRATAPLRVMARELRFLWRCDHLISCKLNSKLRPRRCRHTGESARLTHCARLVPLWPAETPHTRSNMGSIGEQDGEDGEPADLAAFQAQRAGWVCLHANARRFGLRCVALRIAARRPHLVCRAVAGPVPACQCRSQFKSMSPVAATHGKARKLSTTFRAGESESESSAVSH